MAERRPSHARSRQRDRRGRRDRPERAGASSSSGRWSTWGELGSTDRRRRRARRHARREGRHHPAEPPGHVGCLLGVLRAGGCVVTINPQRGVERTRDDIAGLELDQHRRDERRPGRRSSTRPRRATTIALDDLGESPTVTGARRGTDAPTRERRRRRRGADADERHDRPAQAHRPDLRHARARAARRQVLRDATGHRAPGCGPAWRSSTRRSCTSAGCSASCSASTTVGRSRCSNGSPSTAGTTRCAATARGRRASCRPRCGWCSRPTSTPTS